MPACTWRDGAGTHALVLGVGVVSCQRAEPGSGASLERTRGVGLLALPGGLVVGMLDRVTLGAPVDAPTQALSAALEDGRIVLIVFPGSGGSCAQEVCACVPR